MARTAVSKGRQKFIAAGEGGGARVAQTLGGVRGASKRSQAVVSMTGEWGRHICLNLETETGAAGALGGTRVRYISAVNDDMKTQLLLG